MNAAGPAWLQGVMDRFAARDPRLVEMARRQNEGRSVTSRAQEDGHFTASACVLDPRTDKVLMIFSSKFHCWLLPGGHIDPGETPFDAALRELEEECGVPADKVMPRLGATPAAIDIHLVPTSETRGEPEHLHFDLQFLFEINELQVLNYVVGNSEVELVDWQPKAKLAESYPDLSAAIS